MKTAILLLACVASVTFCDAKFVFPIPRDDASDAYIDQVINE
jgi:hypothetical protein